MAKPDFLLRDPGQIVTEMVADFEQRTKRTLQPAQPERLQIDAMAYREVLLREQIQDALLLNLVRHSRAPVLDELAVDRGEQRLPAFAAGCTLEFRLPAPAAQALPVPAGTRVGTANGALAVATVAAVQLQAGQLAVSVKAQAIDAGAAGNGYLPGQLSQLLTPLAGAPSTLTVGNTTATEGGADEETDERLQQRLLSAFDRYSVGGPAPAYRYQALSAHPGVIDVAVRGHHPEPGDVTLYPLLDTGLPGQTVLDAVQAYAADETRRVLNDTIFTRVPTVRDFRVRATLWPAPGERLSTEQLDAAKAAVAALMAQWSTTLGGDIVPSRITTELQGHAYRVELSEPVFVACAPWEWRRCTDITLTPPEGA